MATWWQEIRARVESRAAELGRSVRSVLIEAGVSRDILYRERSDSHKVDTLQKIAAALGWSLPQIMGFDVLGSIPRDILAAALRVANGALRNIDYTEDDFIDALLVAQNLLLKRRYMGAATDDAMLATLEQTIAEAYAAAAQRRRAAASLPDAPPSTNTENTPEVRASRLRRRRGPRPEPSQ